MKVQVGAYWYTVRVSHRVPEDKAGLCIWATKEILISPRVSLDDRLDVLCHEYKEAYLMHYPAPQGKEQACDLFAALFKQLVESLGQTGGLTAIRRLIPEKPASAEPVAVASVGQTRGLVYEPADVPYTDGGDDWTKEPSNAPVKVDVTTWRDDPTKAPPGRMLDTRYCPGCGAPVPGPRIVDVRQEDPHFGPVLFRTIYCGCLPGLWHWFEPAGAKWKPAIETGSLEARPRKTTDGARIAEWMKAYPHAVPPVSD